MNAHNFLPVILEIIFVPFVLFFVWVALRTERRTKICSEDWKGHTYTPIIPGDRKDGWNDRPISQQPMAYRPTVQEYKEYRRKMSKHVNEWKRFEELDQKNLKNIKGTCTLSLSDGLFGRKDRKGDPKSPKPTTRPWAQ